MDEIALFFSSKGRIDRRTFGWCVLAIYVAGFFSQALLSGNVIARAGLLPFIAVQVALIWAWTVLHIKRLRDANEGPAGAIGVAIVYSLAVGLLVLIVSLFTGFAAHSGDRPSGGPASPGDAAMALFLILLIVSMLYSSDLGVFATLIKILVVIACLPALISFVFSLRTGMRPSAAAAQLPPPAPFQPPSAAPPPPTAAPPPA